MLFYAILNTLYEVILRAIGQDPKSLPNFMYDWTEHHNSVLRLPLILRKMVERFKSYTNVFTNYSKTSPTPNYQISKTMKLIFVGILQPHENIKLYCMILWSIMFYTVNSKINKYIIYVVKHDRKFISMIRTNSFKDIYTTFPKPYPNFQNHEAYVHLHFEIPIIIETRYY